MTRRQHANMARALSNQNYRRYLIGQGISHAGQWIQIVAELWLIVRLTDSGTALGLHSVFRFGPILLIGVFAGAIGDRFDRRRLLLLTQGLHTLATTTLAIVALMSTPTLGMVYGIVLAQGIINAVDNPVRRSFLRDLTEDDDMTSAVGLHSTVATLGRAIGPALAGVLITAVGVEWCFAVNALTYVAVLVSLVIIDPTRLRPSPPSEPGGGRVRDGLKYVWHHRQIRSTLMLTIVTAVFAWQWSVILPVYARADFSGDARLFGLFVSTLSVGSVIGALSSARRRDIGGRHLRVTGGMLSLSLAVIALAPSVAVAFVGMAFLGASGSAFNTGAQSRVQLAVDDHMTSRVLALYSVGFAGGQPVGAVLTGAIIDQSGARAAFAVGSIVLGVTTLSQIAIHRRRHTQQRNNLQLQ